MAQPVRVLHIVDSIAIVVEIVDVRDPVVVVVHVNCNWGFAIEERVWCRSKPVKWHRTQFDWQILKRLDLQMCACKVPIFWLGVQSFERFCELNLFVFLDVLIQNVILINVSKADWRNVMSTFHLSKCKQNGLKKTNRHLGFHLHQNLGPNEKWLKNYCNKMFFLMFILKFFDSDEKFTWWSCCVLQQNILSRAQDLYGYSLILMTG